MINKEEAVIGNLVIYNPIARAGNNIEVDMSIQLFGIIEYVYGDEVKVTGVNELFKLNSNRIFVVNNRNIKRYEEYASRRALVDKSRKDYEDTVKLITKMNSELQELTSLLKSLKSDREDIGNETFSNSLEKLHKQVKEAIKGSIGLCQMNTSINKSVQQLKDEEFWNLYF